MGMRRLAVAHLQLRRPRERPRNATMLDDKLGRLLAKLDSLSSRMAEILSLDSPAESEIWINVMKETLRGDARSKAEGAEYFAGSSPSHGSGEPPECGKLLVSPRSTLGFPAVYE